MFQNEAHDENEAFLKRMVISNTLTMVTKNKGKGFNGRKINIKQGKKSLFKYAREKTINIKYGNDKENKV